MHADSLPGQSGVKSVQRIKDPTLHLRETWMQDTDAHSFNEDHLRRTSTNPDYIHWFPMATMFSVSQSLHLFSGTMKNE